MVLKLSIVEDPEMGKFIARIREIPEEPENGTAGKTVWEMAFDKKEDAKRGMEKELERRMSSQ